MGIFARHVSSVPSGEYLTPEVAPVVWSIYHVGWSSMRLRHLERRTADFYLVHPARWRANTCKMDHSGLIFEPVLVHSARMA